MKKRMLALLLTLVMVMTLLPVAVFAEEATPTQTEAVEGSVTDVPEVPETPETPETPEAPKAPETPAVPATPVEKVQAMIDGLPTLESVQKSDRETVQAAYDAYCLLTEEQKAQVTGSDVFEKLLAWFDGQDDTLEGAVAKVGGVGYATLDEAYAAVNDTNNILTLLQDVVISGTFSTSKTMTLDLNGHMLESSGTAVDVSGGTLTVADSVGSGKIVAYWCIRNDGGTLLLTGGKLEASYIGVFSYFNSFTMMGGTISSGSYGIATSSGGSINMEGGTASGNHAAVHVDGTLNANNGTLEGDIEFLAGHINIGTPGTTITGNVTNVNYPVVTFMDGDRVCGYSANSPRVSFLDEPVKAGKIFKGWYTGVGGTGDKWDKLDRVTGNMTLYAGWEDVEYTVTFDTDGGSLVSNKTVSRTDKLLEGVSEPTKAGAVFAGWTYNGTPVTPDTTLDDLMTGEPDGLVVLKAQWENIITLTVPFVTTVKQEGNTAPGETTFDLAVVQAGCGADNYPDVTCSGTVTTNGARDYNGTFTITGPETQVHALLGEGAFVGQTAGTDPDWKYADEVWALMLNVGPDPRSGNDDGAQEEYSVVVLAALNEDGMYDIDWAAPYPDHMTFTNTYTKDVHTHDYDQKFDSKEHWKECDCGDVQEKEVHKFSQWQVTRAATETAKGEQTRTCSVCGYTEKAEIPATKKPDAPHTGDGMNLGIWMALALAGAATLAGVVKYRPVFTDKRK